MKVQTKYARNGDVHIGYQVWGSGPDILFIPDWLSHIDIVAELPELARFMERLSGFSRLIMMDMRGVGASDPVVHSETTREQWIGDIAAVMAAAGTTRPTLLGMGHSSQLCMLFAAAHPEAVQSMILMNGYARLSRAEDYKPGMPLPVQQQVLTTLENTYGDGTMIRVLAPSISEAPGALDWWAKTERLAASPGRAIAKQKAILALDVRDVLPKIRAPTLLLHSKYHLLYRPDHSRYLAEHIAGARYVELPGADHWPLGEELYADIEEFVTGKRPVPEPERILATLLFTDLVGSTQKAEAMGDKLWRNLLDSHDRILRDCVATHRGQVMNWAGDGMVAKFDGPARAIRCAIAARQALQRLGLEIRAGVHTGEVELETDERLRGLNVHIGARVASAAGSGEIYVSSTVRDLAGGSGFRFEDRGSHALKGVPDEWRLFAIGG
jgi:class 3 adenylate cyclase/pimeloyl-ACP methyl ester carboxylesterase